VKSTKRILTILTLLLLLPVFSLAQSPAESPVILVFYEEGCPSCELVEELIGELAADLPPEAIRRYEISSEESLELLASLEKEYEVQVNSVPAVFVGDEAILGSGRSEEFALRAAIGDCVVYGCASPLDLIKPPPFPWNDLLVVVMFGALWLLLAIGQIR